MEINYTNYIELKKTGISRAAMADIFEIPDWKLKKLIATNGWGTKRPTISNETAFDEYSEEACYWAGFLAADGCVDAKNRVRVMLKYDDLGHLEKLKDFLKSTHTISTNTDTYNRCSFELTSAHICDMLDINYGIIPNKTDKLTFPIHIPTKYLVHYIRGYFDGDGSICESFSNKNSKLSTLYTTFVSGSDSFIRPLYEFLKVHLNIGGHLHTFTDSKKFQLQMCTNDSKDLLSYLYEDSSVYLDRKYLMYQRIVVEDIRKTRDNGIVQTI